MSLAAAPVIVRDLGNVFIDGINSGCVADVFANYPARRAELRDAFAAFVDSLPVEETSAEEMAAVQNAADLFAS